MRYQSCCTTIERNRIWYNQMQVLKHWIGAGITLSCRTVSYESQLLTETGSQHRTVQREIFFSCWSREKFHHYDFGKKLIKNRSKATRYIWKKMMTSASPSLIWILLKMAKYGVGSDTSRAEPIRWPIPLSCRKTKCPGSNLMKLRTNSHFCQTRKILECTNRYTVLAHLKVVVHNRRPDKLNIPNAWKKKKKNQKAPEYRKLPHSYR